MRTPTHKVVQTIIIVVTIMVGIVKVVVTFAMSVKRGREGVVPL